MKSGIEIYSMLQVLKLQFTMNKLSIETKLFIILFTLGQLIKFVSALMYEKLE